MVNGKKLLASVLVGAMVITGNPVVPTYSVFAETAAPFKVTIGYNSFDSIVAAVNAATEDSTITVTGTIPKDVEFVEVGKKINY